MKRRDFHRMAGLAAGGLLVPRIVSGAWVTVGAPRFQVARTASYAAGDLAVDVTGPVPSDAVATASIVTGMTHYWRVATDGMTHYYGRIEDRDGLRNVADMVNAVTIPFLNALHGTSVDVETETPAGFALEQNYPNPFNPATTIPFEVDRPGSVTLRVYDMSGREVATLVSGSLPAGRHEAHWNASGHASGVYLAVLRSDAQTKTLRMTLVK